MKISLFGLDNMSKNAMYNVVILIRVHFQCSLLWSIIGQKQI